MPNTTRHFICFIVVLLCGCSSLHPGRSFSSEENKAFVMVVADGLPVNFLRSYSFIFQQVDLEKSTFLSESFFIDFDAPFGAEELLKPTELKTTLRFSGKPVTAGSYALVSRAPHTPRETYVSDVGVRSGVNCLALAPVFNFSGGSINILSLGEGTKPDVVADSSLAEPQLKLVLAGYPRLSAPGSTSKDDWYRDVYDRG